MNNRLLIYGDYYIKPSGFAREFRDLIPELQKLGWDIRQVALGYNGFPEDKNIKVYPGKFYKLDSYWAREMLEYAIKDFDPDIVLSLGDYYMLPKIAFAMAYPHKAKWIHWGVLDGAPLGFGCKEPLKWVDYNLGHSDFALDEIRKVLPDIQGEKFIPATNPDIFYEMNKKKLRKEFGCEDKYVITTVARNQTRKNLPALLEAMRYLRKDIPNAMLLLGLTQQNTITPEGALEGHQIQYLIDYFEVNDCVVIPKEKDGKGSLTDKTIREIYNLGDIFCLPSMGEGFGMIFHESLACGVPVLGTECSAIPETIKDFGSYLHPESFFYTQDGVSQAVVNSLEVMDAIDDAHSRKDEFDKKGQEGKIYVSQFTPINQAKKLDEIMKRVISEDIKSIMRQEV
jgi:glycosyltransferase involved in cell wall biosynthesis